MVKTKNEILLTFQRISILILLVFSMDFLIGSGLEWLYFRQKTGTSARITFGIDSTRADLLILGSSGATHHYVPSVFKEVLNLSTYNAGKDGIDVLYTNAILKIILKRYSPKIIILNVTPYEFTNYAGYERLSVLLPYCFRHPELKEILYLRGNSERLKIISHTYPYNSSFLTILKGVFYTNPDTIIDNGYVALFKKIDPVQSKVQAIAHYIDLDPIRINAMNEILELCKKKGISFYLSMSPIYYYNNEGSVVLKKIEEISGKAEIPFLNLVNDNRFKGETNLFQDNGHMNHLGAVEYSNIVADYILEDLLKKKQD